MASVKVFGAACILLGASICSYGYENRDFLMKEYAQTGNVFLMEGQGLPYPAYSDREAWEKIAGAAAPALVRKGEELLGYEWKNIPLSAYLEYERTGERYVMQAPFESNRRALNALIVAELVEGRGRFIDQIANGVWYSCNMPSWVLSAHQVRQKSRRALPDTRENIIDLASAGYGATIALAWHFFHDAFDRLDPSLNYTIEKSLKTKILDPFLDPSVRKANWWMADNWKPGMIVNNWNPWCNSNVLVCFLVMEKDPERFREAIETSLHSVDQFINYVKADGACEEGPAYWDAAGGKLYDYLQLLYYASEGRFSIMDNPMVKNIGEYIVRSYIGDGYVVNFADATARLRPEPTLIMRFGKATGSSLMTGFAMYLMADSKTEGFTSPMPVMGNDTFRSLESLRTAEEMREEADSLESLAAESSFDRVLSDLYTPECTWYPETEFAYFRNREGWFAAAKGGFNNESHNHNDAGTFILYIDNVPIFVDAGVGTYTKQTFSEDRYSIWTMQSNWHNLPLINGTSQIFGSEFKACDVSCDLEGRKFSADISKAYSGAASCRKWVRSYSLEENSFVISDRFELSERILPDSVNFLVQGEVFLPGEDCGDGQTVPEGSIVVRNGGKAVRMTYSRTLTPSVEVMELGDPRLSGIWGPVLRRISLAGREKAPLRGTLKFVVTEL